MAHRLRESSTHFENKVGDQPLAIATWWLTIFWGGVKKDGERASQLFRYHFRLICIQRPPQALTLFLRYRTMLRVRRAIVRSVKIKRSVAVGVFFLGSTIQSPRFGASGVAHPVGALIRLCNGHRDSDSMLLSKPDMGRLEMEATSYIEIFVYEEIFNFSDECM